MKNFDTISINGQIIDIVSYREALPNIGEWHPKKNLLKLLPS